MITKILLLKQINSEQKLSRYQHYFMFTNSQKMRLVQNILLLYNVHCNQNNCFLTQHAQIWIKFVPSFPLVALMDFHFSKTQNRTNCRLRTAMEDDDHNHGETDDMEATEQQDHGTAPGNSPTCCAIFTANANTFSLKRIWTVHGSTEEQATASQGQMSDIFAPTPSAQPRSATFSQMGSPRQSGPAGTPFSASQWWDKLCFNYFQNLHSTYIILYFCFVFYFLSGVLLQQLAHCLEVIWVIRLHT